MTETGLGLLKLVARRSELLTALLEGPREKRSLADGVEGSRSTVDRALKELEEAGLATWTEGGYRATLAGRLQLQLYREFVDRSTDLVDALDALEGLPPDVAIDPGLLRDCRVVQGEGLGRYELSTTLAELLEGADRAVIVMSKLTSPITVRKLVRKANDEGVPLESFLAPELVERLEREVPDLLGGLAAGDSLVYEARVGPFGMLFDPDDGEVVVGTNAADGTPLGLVHNDTAEAVGWAREYLADLRATATDVTADARQMARLAGDRETLATQGFVDLATVEPRDDADPTTGWRTGLELAEVGGGLAVERERPTPEGRRSVVAEVTERLAAGDDVAVLGPSGSGKSTVCKAVAWRWREDDRGPVLYRESGGGAAFEAWPLLVELLRDAEGHALVVVEDATRPAANDVFRVVAEFTDSDDVTVLLDAREHEWHDPPSFPADGRLEAYRVEEIATVPMPPVDAREVERFVDRFEAATDASLAVDHGQLLAAIREGSEGPARPAALQLLLHRLSLRAAPLVVDDYRTPTTLVEDVRRTIDAVEPLGDLGLEVAALANLLAAAGLAVDPAALHAVGAAHDDHDGVQEALGELEGRVLFPEDGGYRTVHASWAALFLDTLCSRLGEDAAAERVGAAVTALLALADDPGRREAVAAAVDGDGDEQPPALERVAADPTDWAVKAVEQLFDAAREYPRLAPLFGTTGGDTIGLPAALPATVRAEVTRRRGDAYLAGGYFDRAAAEFERLQEHVAEWAPERAPAVAVEARTKLATVAYQRGDIEEAETRYRDALEAARVRGDREHVAACRKHLGNVAWTRGELAAAEEQFEAALATYRDLDDRLGAAHVRHNLGNVATRRGDRDAAEDHFRAALATYRELGDRGDEADSLNNLGVVAEERGDLPAAAERYRECLERYRSMGDRVGEARVLSNMGEVAERRADPERAAEYAGRALERYRDVDYGKGLAHALRVLAGADRQRGDHATAAERLAESRERAEAVGDRAGLADLHLRRARLERDRGDPEAATAAAGEAREQATGDGVVAGAGVVLGDVARRRGDHETAAERFETARDGAREAATPLGEAVALAGRAEVALARGAADDAAALVREAAAVVAEAVGADADAGSLVAGACERAGHLEALAGPLADALDDPERPLEQRLDDLAERLENG